MHKTEAGEKRKALKKDAKELTRDAKALQKAAKHLPAVRKEAQKLQEKAETILAEAATLKLQARLEDLTVWEMKKTKKTTKGPKTYVYWMASWREDDKTRNVHLGSSRKIDAESALQKARMMKAEAIHVN
jgi:hypothetical protein